jgi:hypothetical protein
MIMNIFVKVYFENIVFIINNGLLKFKIWTGQLIGLLINWKIHTKIHSKMFIMTKYALKNEIIKIRFEFFSLKP